MIKIGCCGWGYLNCKKHFGARWKERFRSKLQAYASLFDLVEINSTFYRIPKIETARRWLDEARSINKNFEFTIKCNQVITHIDKFAKRAYWAFERMKELAKELKAKILLFQTPSSFKPTSTNLKKVRQFFSSIERNNFILVWEVRWQRTWSKEIVKKLFSELDIEQCIDPFRFDFQQAKKLAYLRLHGKGKPSMYNYKFTKADFRLLLSRIKKSRKTYILFNNTWMYEDSLRFKRLLDKAGLL